MQLPWRPIFIVTQDGPFGTLGMLTNLQNFAHTSLSAKRNKMYASWDCMCYSAPYSILKHQPPRAVSPTATKFDRCMQHLRAHKKASWSHAVNPTGSPPFSVHYQILADFRHFQQQTPPRG